MTKKITPSLIFIPLTHHLTKRSQIVKSLRHVKAFF